MATLVVIDDVAGPHNRKVVSPARAVEREADAAWVRLRGHSDVCQVCERTKGVPNRCALGWVLLDNWMDLHDLMGEPSRWNVVRIIGDW